MHHAVGQFGTIPCRIVGGGPESVFEFVGETVAVRISVCTIIPARVQWRQTVQDLPAVGKTIVVRVGVIRVGFRYLHFDPIIEAVAVGVGIAWLRVADKAFPTVVEAITVGVHGRSGCIETQTALAFGKTGIHENSRAIADGSGPAPFPFTFHAGERGAVAVQTRFVSVTTAFSSFVHVATTHEEVWATG